MSAAAGTALAEKPPRLALLHRAVGVEHSLAVGETVILLHPLSPFSWCFNRDGEGMPAE